jgi:hypothetical protein
MFAAMTSIGTLAATIGVAFLSGVGASLITAYATQARERRDARAHARDAIRRAENVARTLRPDHQAITGALDDLEIRAMIARLPRALVDLYREARIRRWAKWATTPPGDDAPLRDPEAVMCNAVGHQAAKLLVTAAWHPWRAAPWCWYRTRRLQRVLDAGMPVRAQLDRDGRAALRHRERQVVRNRRKARRSNTPG